MNNIILLCCLIQLILLERNNINHTIISCKYVKNISLLFLLVNVLTIFKLTFKDHKFFE